VTFESAVARCGVFTNDWDHVRNSTGKNCFIAAQVVGREGRVIGVDMTDEMLEIARRNAPLVAERIGYANVEFRKGRIQDLALNVELLDESV
jgi:ubiquinone/menaquinone biosynthesis C-methylase UbiE